MKEILNSIAEFTNQVTRPWVTILMVLAMIYAFLFTDKIEGAAFLGIGTAVIIFWFKQRDDEKAAVTLAKVEIKEEAKAAAKEEKTDRTS